MNCWCGGEIYRDECVASPDHNPYATGRKDEIKKLYLSGPMTGYAECNYPAFDGAAMLLREAGFDVVNPTEQDNHGHYTDILREDIRALLDCDGVALLPMWWESNGSRAEVHIAGLLKMPVHELSTWLGEKA